MTDVHSCSYYCTRPACVLAQRNELRDAVAQTVPQAQKAKAACGCRACLRDLDKTDPLPSPGFFITRECTTFVVCSDCGCKRCPHATDHRLVCTGSNDPGQEGSIFGVPLRSQAAREASPPAARPDKP